MRIAGKNSLPQYRGLNQVIYIRDEPKTTVTEQVTMLEVDHVVV